jgi:hypothetical protein
MSDFPTGIISPGDEVAQELGFFPELFDGYLWCDNYPEKIIYISFIESKHPREGHFKKLCYSIEANGYKVAIPSPLPIMTHIVKKWGYVVHYEYSDIAQEDIEVWTKP